MPEKVTILLILHTKIPKIPTFFAKIFRGLRPRQKKRKKKRKKGKKIKGKNLKISKISTKGRAAARERQSFSYSKLPSTSYEFWNSTFLKHLSIFGIPLLESPTPLLEFHFWNHHLHFWNSTSGITISTFGIPLFTKPPPLMEFHLSPSHPHFRNSTFHFTISTFGIPLFTLTNHSLPLFENSSYPINPKNLDFNF